MPLPREKVSPGALELGAWGRGRAIATEKVFSPGDKHGADSHGCKVEMREQLRFGIGRRCLRVEERRDVGGRRESERELAVIYSRVVEGTSPRVI